MFFNRKKSNEENVELEITRVISKLKGLCQKDPSLGVVFLVGSDTGGTSFVRGDADQIDKALYKTSLTDSSFATILKVVGGRIKNSLIPDTEDLYNSLPPNLKDIADKMMNDNKGADIVDLPDGTKGLAIRGDKVDDLTDSDIDNIIGKMLDGMDIESDESKE
jgi:hypothetical protein